jgi:hypothetical protein
MTLPYPIYYNPSTNQTYNANQILNGAGYDPTTLDPEVLALRGFYLVNQTNPTANSNLYENTVAYTVVGLVADQVWTATPWDLSLAKQNGILTVDQYGNSKVQQIQENSGFSAEVLAAAGSVPSVDRPPVYETVIAEQVVATDETAIQQAQIEIATSVDEIDSILQQPSGTFVSGRGGDGPLDMNPSYFSELYNLPPGIGEPQLEIYIPGTATVIPYDPGLPPPYYFDSAGNCYTGTDYRTTFRVAATGQVLGTVTPAFGANVPIPWTYNPVIPAASGGSSSSAR